MSSFRHNIQKIYTDTWSMAAWVIAMALIWSIAYYFSDFQLLQGNLWSLYAYAEIALSTLIAVCFGIFVAATVYQWRAMNHINTKKSTSGMVGGFLGVLVMGCPACTITIASYIGLASAISILPRKWIELKIIGLMLLVRSTYQTVSTLWQCKITTKKK